MAALVGGGLKVKPGEVSLAHLGVLFLDELPEFQRAVLDSLRQPLETGEVSVARANAHVTFPARVQLVAAMNPCRCGHLGDAALACARAPRCAADYQGKVSGPLLDRIDLHVEVDAVSAADLVLPPPAEGSAPRSPRASRGAQRPDRALCRRPARAPMPSSTATRSKRFATPDEPGRKLLAQAAEAMRLSARGYTRMLRVARTIADLAGSGRGRPHPCRRGAELSPAAAAGLVSFVPWPLLKRASRKRSRVPWVRYRHFTAGRCASSCWCCSGAARSPSTMGDFGKGVREFRKGMKEGDEERERKLAIAPPGHRPTLQGNDRQPGKVPSAKDD